MSYGAYIERKRFRERLSTWNDRRKNSKRNAEAKFMDGIRDVTGYETVVDALRLAEDKSVWRSVAAYANFGTALQ